MPSETTTAQANSPAEKPQTSPVAAGSTSKDTPTTFTKEQVDKSVRDALAEAGRKHKVEVEAAVVKEREAQATSLKESVARIADLEAELDEAVSGDADKSEILKIKRQLRNEIAVKEQAVANKEKALAETQAQREQEWQAHEAEIQAARSEAFAITAWDIADEYEGGDAVKLKAICERSKNLTEEFAREMASTLWVKKSEVKKALVEGTPDSGGTAGGSNSWESIRDAYSANPNDPTVKAQYMEARRKRGI